MKVNNVIRACPVCESIAMNVEWRQMTLSKSDKKRNERMSLGERESRGGIVQREATDISSPCVMLNWIYMSGSWRMDSLKGQKVSGGSRRKRPGSKQWVFRR